MNTKKTMVILDANAFVHSSFNGYEPQLDIKGNDQRVLYGIMNALVSLSYNIPEINFLYVVFDPEDGSLYRKSLYPIYKENRPPPNPELVKQKIFAKKIIKDYLGVPTVSYSGYEADDIIGTLSKKHKNEYRVVIVSPDKDMVQLIEDDVIILKKVRTKLKKGYKAISIDNIYEEFGVNAHQIPDWLALMGDTADNLPGLENVGAKTACKILNEYPSIEHLLSIVHEHKDEKFKNKVIQSKESLLLVKKLATIVCDLPMDEEIELCLKKAEEIRTHNDYNKKLISLKNYFNWPMHYVEMFL